MSNYRISASMKDDIRKAYRRKINAIDEKIKDKSRVLVGTLLEDLNNNPKTEEFKECDMNCMAYDGGICKMMEGNK